VPVNVPAPGTLNTSVDPLWVNVPLLVYVSGVTVPVELVFWALITILNVPVLPSVAVAPLTVVTEPDASLQLIGGVTDERTNVPDEVETVTRPCAVVEAGAVGC
jgi:hypothetical protein